MKNAIRTHGPGFVAGIITLRLFEQHPYAFWWLGVLALAVGFVLSRWDK